MPAQTSAKVAPAQAIVAVQTAIRVNGSHKKVAPIELENVAPALLLPPAERGSLATALAGALSFLRASPA